MPEIQASFLHTFSYASLGEGRHISGEFFAGCFWGLFVANPLGAFSSRIGVVSACEIPPELGTRLRAPASKNRGLQ